MLLAMQITHAMELTTCTHGQNYEVCPPVLQWYSLVSESTPPKDSKTLKISRGSFHSRLGQFWPDFLQTKVTLQWVRNNNCRLVYVYNRVANICEIGSDFQFLLVILMKIQQT